MKFVYGMGSILLLVLGFSLLSCRATVPNRNPVGEIFPTVAGQDLREEPWVLPRDLGGKPAILLVGYVQNAQFDLDRWLLGLSQAETPIAFYEVPTIVGLVPGMFASSIDDGMRRGIPREDWGGVVTVYGDAGKILDRTGNENPNNGRILLLDGSGRIVWYHDRGFSAGKMLELDREARKLVGK